MKNDQTFSKPVSTGMRKRTSDTRLWYKSRTFSTRSRDGGAKRSKKRWMRESNKEKSGYFVQ